MLQERVVRASEQNVGAARSFSRRTGLIVLVLVNRCARLEAAHRQCGLTAGGPWNGRQLRRSGRPGCHQHGAHGDQWGSWDVSGSSGDGIPPGKVNGAIHKADAAALQAKKDLTTAYNDAAGRTPVTTIGTQLGGKTLKPGVYDSNSGTFQITGTLTLDAQGDPNGVFIFQMAATLVSASNSNVRLIGAAQPCNVYWRVGSSATLGTNSTFTGNILALTSIQVLTKVTVEGRVLARNASVTLDADTITAATCSTSSPTPSSSSQVTPVPSGGVQTGGGSTAGLQDVALLVFGGALLAAAAGTFAMRRRSMRHD
jgi:Ice-binding-like